MWAESSDFRGSKWPLHPKNIMEYERNLLPLIGMLNIVIFLHTHRRLFLSLSVRHQLDSAVMNYRDFEKCG